MSPKTFDDKQELYQHGFCTLQPIPVPYNEKLHIVNISVLHNRVLKSEIGQMTVLLTLQNRKPFSVVAIYVFYKAHLRYDPYLLTSSSRTNTAFLHTILLALLIR